MTESEKKILAKMATIEELLVANSKKIDRIQRMINKLVKYFLRYENDSLIELEPEMLAKNLREFDLTERTLLKLASVQIFTLGDLSEFSKRKTKGKSLGKRVGTEIEELLIKLDVDPFSWR